MQLNPTDFNRFLLGIGQSFAWRKAYICPCVSPATNAPTLDCPQCHGKGYLWADPVHGVAGVPSQSVQREFAKMGQWESGDMVLTIGSNSPLYDIGERDRLVMLDGDDPFSINLRRGYNDVLPWTAKAIQRVYWLNAGAVVEGSIPSQDATGTLQFVEDAPPTGTMYSVTGRKYSEFFVFQSFPVDRGHHGGLPLPVRVQLRRFDLFGR